MDQVPPWSSQRCSRNRRASQTTSGGAAVPNKAGARSHHVVPLMGVVMVHAYVASEGRVLVWWALPIVSLKSHPLCVIELSYVTQATLGRPSLRRSIDNDCVGRRAEAHSQGTARHGAGPAGRLLRRADQGPVSLAGYHHGSVVRDVFVCRCGRASDGFIWLIDRWLHTHSTPT